LSSLPCTSSLRIAYELTDRFVCSFRLHIRQAPYSCKVWQCMQSKHGNYANGRVTCLTGDSGQGDASAEKPSVTLAIIQPSPKITSQGFKILAENTVYSASHRGLPSHNFIDWALFLLLALRHRLSRYTLGTVTSISAAFSNADTIPTISGTLPRRFQALARCPQDSVETRAHEHHFL
jgi:hypothetical protein